MRTTRRTAIAGCLLLGCATLAPPGWAARFLAADGAQLTGRIYGSGRRGVLLAPGGHGVGETWHGQATRLAAAGFHVLALDYRGRGTGSAAPPDDSKAHLDLIGGIRQLRSAGAAEVSVVGASLGGWAAAEVAASMPDSIHRLVLLAHSAFDRPEALTMPKLFAVARDDRDGTGRLRLRSIESEFARSPEPKELLVLDGAAHAQFLFLTAEGDRVYAAIEAFLSG